MTTIAKVLTVANLVLAVAFIFLTAPVAQKRIDRIKQVEAEQAKLPPLRNQINQMEAQRAELQQAITRQNAALDHLIVTGLNRQGDLTRQVAALEDEKKGLAAKEAKWAGALAETKEEVAAREQEHTELEEKIEEAETLQSRIRAQVNDLTARVEKTKKAEADLRQQIQSNYTALLELEQKVAENQPSVSLSDRE